MFAETETEPVKRWEPGHTRYTRAHTGTHQRTHRHEAHDDRNRGRLNPTQPHRFRRFVCLGAPVHRLGPLLSLSLLLLCPRLCATSDQTVLTCLDLSNLEEGSRCRGFSCSRCVLLWPVCC
jgi:hypothetical protein